jgi:hypothetical protein
MLKHLLSISLFLAASSSALFAGQVQFDAWGTVGSASGATGAYSGVQAGQSAHLVFLATTPGTDIVPGHVTNFAIVPASLQLTLGPVTVGVVGGSPVATMRNDDPAVDGVLASATLTSSKNLGFSFSSCNTALFSSTDPEQNYGLWTSGFYCVYGWTVTGSGTFIDVDLSSFQISQQHLGLALCFGDGTQALACPCANSGLTGHGCDNSIASGGAVLSASGLTSADNVVLSASGELPSSLSVFLQGNQFLSAPLSFGDGLRCAGGVLKRLYIKNASGGAVSAPAAGELSVSAQSALLGDAIAPGTSRWYQVYYRDPSLAFCPNPPGNSWNVSSGLAVSW